MKSTNKALLAAATAAFLCVMGGCGNQDESKSTSYPQLRPGETLETLAVLTDAPTETTKTSTQASIKNPIYALGVEASQTVTTTAAQATTTTTTAATATTEPFQLTEELVATKMYEFYSKKGYTEAQIAGIVGNAEKESGLNPLRFVSSYDSHSWFGLFMLIDCPRRNEMFAEFEAQGVGKYTTSDYWEPDSPTFDSAEDFDKFMEIFLEYSMDPNDTQWMTEIQNTEVPEEAAEIFLIYYERAIGGESQIEYYEPLKGQYYQNTSARREAARRWYEYFTA